MNNQNKQLEQHWSTLARAVRFKVRYLLQCSSCASPYKGQHTGVEQTDPAWNALAEGRIISSFFFAIELSEVRFDQHHPRHLWEHLATHDVLSLTNSASFQCVGVSQTGCGRSTGSIGVTTTRRVDIHPAKRRSLAQLSPGVASVFRERGWWGDFPHPPLYRRPKSLACPALKKSGGL
jgi:hypothetical protein